MSHDVPAYSGIYGMLPYSLFATSEGWKTVGPRANHYTGKSDEVMKNRLAARARYYDASRIDQYRRNMIRIANAQLEGDRLVVEVSDNDCCNAIETKHQLRHQ